MEISLHHDLNHDARGRYSCESPRLQVLLAPNAHNPVDISAYLAQWERK